jgi:hypothetical protein
MLRSMRHAAESRRTLTKDTERCKLSTLRQLLVTKEASEVFMPAVDGLIQDLPALKVFSYET